ncbi:ATP-dependent DNA helicase RecQ-like [Mercenaria mercenaria]|uniref:ATP-dependent DNA helicase RecQ-like n=1 Tax=Mercenaria mercenaria TaxID=6596 RepID=UPI00234F387F|nr:ATP-dependent DNA helicase RecQ-like [Mercenaria mercenaria]
MWVTFCFQNRNYSAAISEYNKIFRSDLKSLKELQEKAITVLISGKDCICSLPTGYGKSLIYELLPFIDHGCLVIVIAPLNAIIKQQVQKLCGMAMCFSGVNDISRLKSGEISYVFSHPEEILQSRELNDAFTSDRLNTRKIYLVVDEAHCIHQWGDEFRPEYRNLSNLRSVFKCQVLALSATVTESGQKQIISNLLMKNCQIICASPAKDNIELIVKKRPSPNAKGNTASSPYDFIFSHVITELNCQLDAFPLTVVYCKSMQWIGYGYEMARQLLADNFYAGDKTQ